MIHRGRAVLAMNCVLAGAESQRRRPLNSVVRVHLKLPRIAIGSGRCADGARSGDASVRELCARLTERIAALRTQPAARLRELAPVNVEREKLGEREAVLITYRDELAGGSFLVAVQGFVPSWRFPKYFGGAGIGHMYAEGLVVSSEGVVSLANEQLLWQFR